MFTLNKTKKETKIILKWGGISLIIIFLFFIGVRFLTFIKDSLTPPPPPQASFGKLFPIPFPNQSKENIIYSLDTVSGFLPNFGDRAKVYKKVMAPPTLLAFDKAKEKVGRLGFNPNGIKISEDVYQWTDQSSLQRRITMNIFSSDFTLSSIYLTLPSLQNFSNEEEAIVIRTARSFLEDMSSSQLDFDEEKTKVTKISDAKIIKVDFFQKDIEGLPIYYEKGISSTINVSVAKDNGLKIVEAHYSNSKISQESSTYAIKSSLQAFEELKKGRGYVAYKPEGIVEITIEKVLLGYYIGDDHQDFLLPIYIFLGDNDFTAYVSAVRDQWISN